MHAHVAGQEGVTGRQGGSPVSTCEVHGADVPDSGVALRVEGGDGDVKRGLAVAVAGAVTLKTVAGRADTAKGLESAAVRVPSLAWSS